MLTSSSGDPSLANAILRTASTACSLASKRTLSLSSLHVPHMIASARFSLYTLMSLMHLFSLIMLNTLKVFLHYLAWFLKITWKFKSLTTVTWMLENSMFLKICLVALDGIPKRSDISKAISSLSKILSWIHGEAGLILLILSKCPLKLFLFNPT